LWSGRCYPLKKNTFIESKLTEWKGRNIAELWGRGKNNKKQRSTHTERERGENRDTSIL
jgi:hypothetical protein